ncbi:MAG: HAMP domain-containing protein, partial [Anaerolineales bacterium]|nr:HAMP domain-containing protein [Anaerolineales bacterium]
MSIKRKLLLGIVVSLGLGAVAIGLLLGWAWTETSDSISHVQFSNEVVQAVFELDIVTNDYLLHHEARAKRQWHLRADSLERLFEEVEVSSLEAQAILNRFVKNYANLQPLFDQLVAEYERQDSSEEDVALSESIALRLVGQITQISQLMIEDSQLLLEESMFRMQRVQLSGGVILLATTFLIFLVLITINVRIGNSVAEGVRKLTQAAEIIAGGGFDHSVEVVGDDEISHLAIAFNEMTAKLKRGQEEIRILNVELEHRVLQRTADLEAVNKELESFSYSVSHDLRAPLRAMDGFSQAILEDYSESVDETGRDYLNRIRH